MPNTDNAKNILNSICEFLNNKLSSKYQTKVLPLLQSDEVLQLVQAQVKVKPTKKRRSRKKDPAAPKGACTAYIMFCNTNRKSIKDEHPDMSSTEITKVMGSRWSALSDDEKLPYKELSAADKARYDNEMSSYIPSEEWISKSAKNDSKDGSKKKAKKTKKNGPKRGVTPYIAFCTQMRASVKENNPNMDAKEVTKELGRLWSTEYKNDKKKRKPFMKAAEKDKLRYENEKSTWISNDADSADNTDNTDNADDADNADSADMDLVSDKKSSVKKKNKKGNSTVEQKSSTKKASKKLAKKSKDTNQSETDIDNENFNVSDGVEEMEEKTGFVSFCQQTRPTIQQENPKWSTNKVTAKLHKLWNSMDVEEQAEYS